MRKNLTRVLAYPTGILLLLCGGVACTSKSTDNSTGTGAPAGAVNNSQDAPRAEASSAPNLHQGGTPAPGEAGGPQHAPARNENPNTAPAETAGSATGHN